MGDRADEDEDDLAAVVPAAFTQHKERRDPPTEPVVYTFEALKGEKVVVRANGFEYRGTLIGADEGEIYLRGEMRWVVLPLSTVTQVRREDTRVYRLGGWVDPDAAPDAAAAAAPDPAAPDPAGPDPAAPDPGTEDDDGGDP